MRTPKSYPFARLGYDEQEAQRAWARANYQAFAPISGLWHPIAQYECVRINAETGYVPDPKYERDQRPARPSEPA